MTCITTITHVLLSLKKYLIFLWNWVLWKKSIFKYLFLFSFYGGLFYLFSQINFLLIILSSFLRLTAIKRNSLLIHSTRWLWVKAQDWGWIIIHQSASSFHKPITGTESWIDRFVITKIQSLNQWSAKLKFSSSFQGPVNTK